MKNIKSFDKYYLINESVGVYKCTTVTFNPSGETVTALYINDKLHTYGDYYHDKIENRIEGFIEGLVYAGCDVINEKVNCNDEQLNDTIVDLAGSPPENLSDIPQD